MGDKLSNGKPFDIKMAPSPPPRGRVSFASAVPLVLLLAGASVVAWLGQVSSLLEVDDATRTAVAVARSEIDALRVRLGNLQSEFDSNQP